VGPADFFSHLSLPAKSSNLSTPSPNDVEMQALIANTSESGRCNWATTLLFRGDGESDIEGQ